MKKKYEVPTIDLIEFNVTSTLLVSGENTLPEITDDLDSLLNLTSGEYKLKSSGFGW